MMNKTIKAFCIVAMLIIHCFNGSFAFSQDLINRNRTYPQNEKSRIYLLDDKIPTYETKNWLQAPNFEGTEINIITEQDLRSSNKMKNWTYNNSNNDYYNDNVAYLANLGYSKSEIKSYKFNTFPIKYNITPTNSSRNMIIRKAIQEMSFYFSMKETSSLKDADLIIEVINPNEIKQKCPKESIESFGCGFNSERDQAKSAYIGITKPAFRMNNIKGVVLHFLGHTFGIAVHSNNSLDLMSKITSPKNNSSDTDVENDDENSFSERDLNTLYRIYNSQ